MNIQIEVPYLTRHQMHWVGMIMAAFTAAGCVTPPPPQHDPVVDQAWSRFLLCELPPEQRPEGCK